MFQPSTSRAWLFLNCPFLKKNPKNPGKLVTGKTRKILILTVTLQVKNSDACICARSGIHEPGVAAVEELC